MRVLSSLIALGAITASATAQKVIPMSFSRAGPQHKGPERRSSTFSQQINNNLTGGGYFAEVALGTPPQNVTLILDTGSSDVWVLDSKADLCHSMALESKYGSCLSTYDSAQSSTFQSLDQEEFSIQYLDGSGASGVYIKDDLHVAGANVKALQVGLAQNTTINSGLLGVGFDTNVAASTIYQNIIDTFVNEGLIHTKAYSLYLNDLDAEIGTILFGGIDTQQFIGALKVVDIQPDPQSKIISSFTVLLDSLTVGSGANFLPQAIPVVLDSGTTLTYLPQTVAIEIYSIVHAVDDTLNTGFVYVNCDIVSSLKNTTFDFQFGGNDGPIVKVPIHELVLDNVSEYVAQGLELPALPFAVENTCSFGINGLNGYYLLGDTFLRSAYVVYDLSQKQIALAQGNLNATKTNIVEITTTGIPIVSGVVSQEVSTPTKILGSASEATASTGTDALAPSQSTSDSPAVRVAPAMGWEATAVTLVAAFCSLTGATFLMF
ncbi:aspartic peptidase domain-containing protein [Xylaria sp. CBS 124048]|nr:aspartic peptidase domain-containing protein [Xylaria sp. CBS 124048]